MAEGLAVASRDRQESAPVASELRQRLKNQLGERQLAWSTHCSRFADLRLAANQHQRRPMAKRHASFQGFLYGFHAIPGKGWHKASAPQSPPSAVLLLVALLRQVRLQDYWRTYNAEAIAVGEGCGPTGA